MRISDWSSDVCSSDLLWKRIADAKATVRHNVKVEWVRAHQNTGSLNDKVDALVNKCARTQEACNGPSLQDGTAQATGTIISDMAGEGRSEEHTSELQSLMRISYAVFCLKKKKTTNNDKRQNTKNKNN